MAKNSCGTCANRIRDGYGYKCRITGLKLRNLDGGCLCYKPALDDITKEGSNAKEND